MLIAFEGVDGSGKTSQVKLLCAHLIGLGNKVCCLKYPDRSSITGALIDGYLKGSVKFDNTRVPTILLAANLWELEEGIERELAKGKTVVMDRHVNSHLAYSMARGGHLEDLRMMTEGIRKPDIVVYLDLNPLDAMKRKSGFALEVLENVDFQTKVYQNYNLIKDPSWICIDALQSESEIHTEIINKF